MKTHYDILGVSRKATSTVIKKAFRDKAKIYHPDVSESPNAHEEFVKIAEAYNILKDPKARADYDRYLAMGGFSSKTTYTRNNRNDNDDFEKARQQARYDAENYATISLEELLNAVLGFALHAGKTFFFGGDTKPKVTFLNYLKMGFLGFLLTLSIFLSFTGIGTVPGIILTVILVNTLFKNNNFTGVIPFIIAIFIFNMSLLIFLVVLVLSLR